MKVSKMCENFYFYSMHWYLFCGFFIFNLSTCNSSYKISATFLSCRWHQKKTNKQANKQTSKNKEQRSLYNQEQQQVPLRTYTQIQRVFTVSGPLLTEPLLHKRATFDSCNQYVNCISKKMCCVLFLCIQYMNGCEPPISGHCSFTSGTLQ